MSDFPTAHKQVSFKVLCSARSTTTTHRCVQTEQRVNRAEGARKARESEAGVGMSPELSVQLHLEQNRIIKSPDTPNVRKKGLSQVILNT